MAELWRAQAACRSVDPDSMFTAGPVAAHIKVLCRACPVRIDCLDHGLKLEGDSRARDRYGVWGGLSARERWQVSKGYRSTEVRL